MRILRYINFTHSRIMLTSSEVSPSRAYCSIEEMLDSGY